MANGWVGKASLAVAILGVAGSITYNVVRADAVSETRIANLERLVETHRARPIHPIAAEQFGQLTADIANVKELLNRVEQRLYELSLRLRPNNP